MKKLRDLGKDEKRMAIAEYECSYCGIFFKTRVANVEKGDTKSCGCMRYILQQMSFKDSKIPKHLRENHTYMEWYTKIKLDMDKPEEWSTYNGFIEDMWEAPSEWWVLAKKNEDLPHSEMNTVWTRGNAYATTSFCNAGVSKSKT